MKDNIKAMAAKYGPIKIRCQAKDSLPIDVILDFQGKLKKRTKANLLKLIERIFSLGFVAPFFVWDHQGDYYLFDGHGRLEAICAIREAGVEIPGAFPVVYIDARDEAEAREILLSVTSQYGEFDKGVLDEWLSSIDIDIAATLRIVDEELDLKSLGINDPLKSGQLEDVYTKKTAAPIYEITGDCPPLEALVSNTKTEKLISAIEDCKTASEGLKDFLKKAAQRHLLFNYSAIAEFYAHQPKEIQELMEQSALVIIDFGKAIENGYVKLSKKIIDQFVEEYVDGAEDEK